MSEIEENSNQESNHVQVKPEKAKVFKLANGYSLTMSKLMKKWKCATPAEWKALRKKHKKENYVGERKKPIVPKEKPQNNYFKNNYKKA